MKGLLTIFHERLGDHPPGLYFVTIKSRGGYTVLWSGEKVLAWEKVLNAGECRHSGTYVIEIQPTVDFGPFRPLDFYARPIRASGNTSRGEAEGGMK